LFTKTISEKNPEKGRTQNLYLRL